MALASTMYRFELDISDVERGVYTQAELRVAQHPSETAAYLLTRVIAYALEYQEDLQMGRDVATPEDPGISKINQTGGTALWIEIGAPSAERMHKVTKLADEVKLYTHREIRIVLQELQSRRVHRIEEVEIIQPPQELLPALEERLDRRMKWSLLRSDGTLYVTIGEETLSGVLHTHRVPPAS